MSLVGKQKSLTCPLLMGKNAFERAANEILEELRSCPPAPGSSGVQIPGERERIQKSASQHILQIPASTWDQICDLAGKHGVVI